MSDQDRHFFDTFALVLGIIVAFTVGIYFLAGSIAAETQHAYAAEEPLVKKLIEERIAPVAKLAVRGGPAPEPVAEKVVLEAREPMSGNAVYDSACSACHAIGVAGAPKLADAAAWAPRIAQGQDVLYSHAINGYQGSAGVMPAKGGRIDLLDEEVTAAVDYMVGKVQ